MIQVAAGTRVYLACRPVDMRKGFDGLAGEVANVLKADPFSGALFLFRSKRGDYLKVLAWDGSGLCLYAKRLEQGRFVWPSIVDAQLKLTPAQLGLLIVSGMSTPRPLSLDIGGRASALGRVSGRGGHISTVISTVLNAYYALRAALSAAAARRGAH